MLRPIEIFVCSWILDWEGREKFLKHPKRMLRRAGLLDHEGARALVSWRRQIHEALPNGNLDPGDPGGRQRAPWQNPFEGLAKELTARRFQVFLVRLCHFRGLRKRFEADPERILSRNGLPGRKHLELAKVVCEALERDGSGLGGEIRFTVRTDDEA